MFGGCPILIIRQEFIADIYHFYLTNFDVILGIDWLSKYHAQIYFLKQKVTLRGPNRDRVVHKKSQPKTRG